MEDSWSDEEHNTCYKALVKLMSKNEPIILLGLERMVKDMGADEAYSICGFAGQFPKEVEDILHKALRHMEYRSKNIT